MADTIERVQILIYELPIKLSKSSGHCVGNISKNEMLKEVKLVEVIMAVV